ncbi:MAG: HAMP domain-containing sensor histidine kinase [Ilumatobacteraceae bacterium]
MSLRARLALGIATIVALSLGLLGFAVVATTRSDLEAAIRRQVEQSLTNRVNSPPHRPRLDGDNDPRTLATAHFAFTADDEPIVAEPAGPPSDPLPLPELTDTHIASLRAGSPLTVESVDGSMRYLVVAGVTADGRLEVEAAPLTAVDDAISALIQRFLVGALITLLLAAGAVVVVLRHGMRPLRKVIDTADAVAAGERETRIPTDEGPTEIRHLSLALDRMLQQQRASLIVREESEARLRRFISDASHELQTPITSVLGWAQLQRKGALDADGEAAAMARIEAEARRMSALVDDLLLLARLDEHRPLRLQPTDLAAVARDAVTDAQAVEPGRPLTLDATAPVIVEGDADRLRQVLDNLLRNVRVHTPADAAATVAVAIADGHAVLTVADHGPGIPPEHVTDVFDRFWRRDPSRTRATGGAGLGLAIVARLVEAHHGTVAVANAPDGGAVFTISLPLA